MLSTEQNHLLTTYDTEQVGGRVSCSKTLARRVPAQSRQVVGPLDYYCISI